MFLKNNLLGFIEDNTRLITPIENRSFNGIDKYLYDKSLTSQPLTIDLYEVFMRFVNPVLLFNLFVILSLFLNFYFFYRFTRLFFNNKLIRIILSSIFSVAPYTLYHSQNHITLVIVWVLILGIELIVNINSTKKAILTGFYLLFATLASNYYGYFLLIFISIFSVLKILFKIKVKDITYKSDVKLLLLSLVTFSLTTILILFPYVRSNLISKNSTATIGTKEVTINGNTKIIEGDSWKLNPGINTDEDIKQFNDVKKVDRKIEDFFVFSSRPWYLFLPAPDNPFFGKFTKDSIHYLQNDWGHWLTNNYFPSEHVAGYLGIINLFLAFIGLVYIRKSLKQKQPKIYHTLLLMLITAIIILILIQPPYITFNTTKIYLPSYLLFEVFPMFRTLARFGIVILAIELIFTGYGYLALLETKKIKFQYIKILLVIVLFFISLAEFYIPFRITNISKPPALYEYLRDNTSSESSFVMYPSDPFPKVYFWSSIHQRQIINPQNYNYPEYGFFEKEFTKKIPTCTGVLESYNLGTDYIIHFPGYNKSKDEIAEAYFNNSPLLEHREDFNDPKSKIYKIKNIDYDIEVQNCQEEKYD
jgi:hypothetical protein